MDVVVIDHHQAGDELPVVDALVNPNRLDDLSGLGHLAAVGLVLVTLVAVNRELRGRGFWSDVRPEPDLLGQLHHVALGTVADVAPLVGLNRALVAKGLIAMRRRDHIGHHRVDGCVAAQWSARGLASRFHAGAAHQCRRPDRPRRSRRAPAAGGRHPRKRRDCAPNSTVSTRSAG